MLTRNVVIKEIKSGELILYGKKSTKLKTAVRLFCGECMGMTRNQKKMEYPIEDIKACTDDLCPLFEWRLGKNPYPNKKRVEAGTKFGARMKQYKARI